MKPIIGIVGRPNSIEEKNASLVVLENYRLAIIKNGGIPFMILPPQMIEYNKASFLQNNILTTEEKNIIDKQLSLCDGILMPGGYKMFAHDFYILDYAIKKDIPVLGICMGMQVMSNYRQEIWNEKNSLQPINHNQDDSRYAHSVTIDKNSKLYSIVKTAELKVNSYHNFHATKSGIYRIAAVSEDGLIEGLELPNAKFNIGVQWHPERLLDDPEHNNIIAAFIKNAKTE